MGTWKIDSAHTQIGFSAKHLMVTTVRGSFSEVEGELTLDEQNPTNSRGEIRVGIGSINTGNEQRDGHLKSTDFFKDSTSKIVGKVTKVEQAGSDYKVTVDLAFNGVTKPVVFDAEFLGIVPGMNGRHFGATLRGKLDRTDWGVSWNMPAGEGLLVSNEIKLELEIAADEGK